MSKTKAILTGILVDIGGSTVLGFIIVLVLAAKLIFDGVPKEEIPQAIQTATTTLPFQVMGYLYGFGMSVLAGYVTARIAQEQIFFCAGIVGVISAMFGYFVGHESYSDGMLVVLTLLTIASVLLGALLWDKTGNLQE